MDFKESLVKETAFIKQLGVMLGFFVIMAIIGSTSCFEFIDYNTKMTMNIYSFHYSGKTIIIPSFLGVVFIPLGAIILITYILICVGLFKNNSLKGKAINIISLIVYTQLFVLNLVYLVFIVKRIGLYKLNLSIAGIIFLIVLSFCVFTPFILVILNVGTIAFKKDIAIQYKVAKEVEAAEVKQAKDTVEALLGLKKLLDAGVISKEEYEKKRKKYLDTL